MTDRSAAATGTGTGTGTGNGIFEQRADAARRRNAPLTPTGSLDRITKPVSFRARRLTT